MKISLIVPVYNVRAYLADVELKRVSRHRRPSG